MSKSLTFDSSSSRTAGSNARNRRGSYLRTNRVRAEAIALARGSTALVACSSRLAWMFARFCSFENIVGGQSRQLQARSRL